MFVSQIKFWTTPMGHRKFRGRSSVKCTYFKAPKATKEATSWAKKCGQVTHT